MKDLMARFGLHVMPFTREIPVEKHFAHPSFDQALAILAGALQKRMSAALIGPAGTGKSALLRALVDDLPAARYRTHYVKVTDLSKRDLCREIAAAAGATPAGSYPRLVRNLQDRFDSSLATDGLRTVLILDDAHDIRPDVLAVLRILTNFDMDSRLVLSVVLSGQTPLRTLLRREAFEDVARRLAGIATLSTLSREETKDYVVHRMNVAGADRIPFTPHAFDALYEIGRGNLRATDVLALAALETAGEKDEETVDQNHVADARRRVFP
jgi:type II secretory pathway predicted ATPase ExeA